MPGPLQFSIIMNASLLLPGALASLVFFVVYMWKHSSSDTKVSALPASLPFIDAWQFFTKRHDFIHSGFPKVKQNLFQFYVRQNKVVVMRGEAARKVFYGDKNLSFNEGYQLFMGGTPRLEDIKVETTNADNLSWFQKKVTQLLHRDRVAELVPELFADLDRVMAAWPASGTLNPFHDINSLVFQLTARAATCREIADNPKQVQKMAQLYGTVERGSNPRAMIFPWLPNRAVKEKQQAVKELYGMLSSIINKRKETGSRNEDAFQVLIDAGDSTSDIIGFTFGVLFSGVANTGISACWALMFLAACPAWKSQAVEEIERFVSKYASDKSGSLASRLSRVPPNAWEDEMPVIDAIICETVRIMSRGASLRRNVKEDIVIEGKVLERGTFMAHAGSTIHFDPAVYTNPEEFDPGRFGKGREEGKNVVFGFVGFGAGRHPCLGRRFAQLEIKAILALFLLGFEYEPVTPTGEHTCVSAADIDRNNIFQARPKDDVLYIQYKKIVL